MKKINQWLLIALVSLTLVTGCKKDNDDEATPSSSFKILAAGRQLNYSFSSFFITDTAFSVYLDIDGSNFKNSQVFYPSGDSSIFWMKDCSGNLVKSPTTTLDCNNIWFKGTTAVGDSWTYNTGTTGVTATHTVVAKGVSVTTPAGTFICDKMTYNQLGTFNTDTFYYNSDYVFVKYEGLLGSYELKSKNY